LDGAVRHVHGGLPAAVHLLDVGALGDEVRDHLVVAARGRVMDCGVAVVIDRVHVGAQLLDEVLHRGEHAGRRKPMGVAGESLSVTDAGCGKKRRNAGTADWHWRQAGVIFRFVRAACPALPEPVVLGRLHRGNLRIRAVGGEQLHGLDVACVRGAPERRRT
jgi:hypothetical protein